MCPQRTPVVICTCDDGIALPSEPTELVNGTKVLLPTLTRATTVSLYVAHSQLAYPTVKSSTFTVVAGTAAKLQVLMPGESWNVFDQTDGRSGSPDALTAGENFNLTVNACDAFWNLRTTDTPSVSLSCDDGVSSLPSGSLINGTSIFTTALMRMTTVTITASAGGYANGVSTTVVVNPNIGKKLQVLLPGECAAPGTTTGKTGSPTERMAGAEFGITVRACDDNWNLLTSAVPVVTLTPSDTVSTIPGGSVVGRHEYVPCYPDPCAFRGIDRGKRSYLHPAGFINLHGNPGCGRAPAGAPAEPVAR